MDKDQAKRNLILPVLKEAVASWQMAFTVIFTTLLFFAAPTPFEGWQPWFWLVGGGLAAGAFLYSTLTDPEMVREALSRQFESQYDLNEIRNHGSRKHLKDAMEYRHNMLTLAKQAKGTLQSHLMQTVDDINDWIGHMYNLAQYIDTFEGNELVKRDRRTVPQQLEKTRRRMDQEEDPAVRRELERQVHQLEQQIANLEASVNGVRRAEIQLESTLSSLGTIYAQMARLGTRSVDNASAQRLRLEIQDEVSGLQDTIEAMDEVHAQSLRLQ
jgi:hypothetical protein